jgi:hypothetical protein
MSALVPGQTLVRRRSTPRDERRAYEACYAEHNRRVMSCSMCDHTARWGGFLEALLAGWAWDWRAGRIVFICPERHIDNGR